MSEYTDTRLETLLSSAIDRSVPDLRAEAARAPVTPIAAPNGIIPSRHNRGLRYMAASLAACLVLVLGLSGFALLGTHSVIGIDVNPSMELTVNYFDKVLSIESLNPEAAEIIGDMDLRFVDLDIAVNALVGSMALQGYFTPGEDVAVLVSVTGGSTAHNSALQKKLALDIETAADTVGARAAVYTQNTSESILPPPKPTDPTPPVEAPTQSPTESSTPPSTTAPAAGPTTVPVAPSPSVLPINPPTTPVVPSALPSSPPTYSPPPSANASVKPVISHGKQVFISKLLALDPTLDENELAAMPIGSIASLIKRRGLDISSIVNYDPDDSAKENIEDFIDDLDDPDDDYDDDDDDDDKRPNSGNHNGWDKKDDDDDDDDDDD